MLPYPMRVAECAELTSKVKALTLDGQLDAQPGQFVMLWLPDVNEKPFSLVSDDPVLARRLGRHHYHPADEKIRVHALPGRGGRRDQGS